MIPHYANPANILPSMPQGLEISVLPSEQSIENAKVNHPDISIPLIPTIYTHSQKQFNSQENAKNKE